MCNFSGMIKNVLPSLRQRAGPQRICSRQKSIRSGTARDSFSQTPHVRGKERVACLRAHKDGITPACAGKSKKPPTGAAPVVDHPRMCGEKGFKKTSWQFIRGSPPHVRGKVEIHCCRVFDVGITPACAGKRSWRSLRTKPARDHPRMCGEKCWPLVCTIWLIGSPPHVRGKVTLRPTFT